MEAANRVQIPAEAVHFNQTPLSPGMGKKKVGQIRVTNFGGQSVVGKALNWKSETQVFNSRYAAYELIVEGRRLKAVNLNKRLVIFHVDFCEFHGVLL